VTTAPRSRSITLMRFFLFAVLAAASFIPVSVRADAIGPPPPSCPEGSSEEFCHGPPTCRARECVSNTDCMPGQECQDRMLCVRDHSCGGRLIEPTYTHVIGPCGPGCAAESGTCEALRVCVPAGSMGPDAGPRDAGARDSGTPGTDAGPKRDAGPGVDAGPGRDSGPPGRDSGPPARDAGSTGGGGSDDGGCGCRTAGAQRGALFAGAFAAGALALAFARSRRRPRR
jgi:MYXO-CTERM domain-containing protein